MDGAEVLTTNQCVLTDPAILVTPGWPLPDFWLPVGAGKPAYRPLGRRKGGLKAIRRPIRLAERPSVRSAVLSAWPLPDFWLPVAAGVALDLGATNCLETLDFMEPQSQQFQLAAGESRG